MDDKEFRSMITGIRLFPGSLEEFNEAYSNGHKQYKITPLHGDQSYLFGTMIEDEEKMLEETRMMSRGAARVVAADMDMESSELEEKLAEFENAVQEKARPLYHAICNNPEFYPLDIRVKAFELGAIALIRFQYVSEFTLKLNEENSIGLTSINLPGYMGVPVKPRHFGQS
jgi:hypothetical protein